MAKQNILLRSKKKKAAMSLTAGRLDDAVKLYSQLSNATPMDADIWLGLGVIAGKKGDPANAVKFLLKAAALQPGSAEIYYNLGIALRDCGDYASAVDAFGKTLKLRADFRDADACLAHAWMVLGRLDDADHAFRVAILRQPGNAELHSNLGSVLQARGFVDKAVARYREALRLNPGLPTYDSLGSALTAQGKFDEALAAYREGLRRQPANVQVYSNLLLTLNYLPVSDPQEVFAEHLGWDRIHGHPADQVARHQNLRDPQKRLRIGYVSPDFRNHSVAYYIEPLIAAHHRDVVEVFCYSEVPRADATTERLRTLADHWRDVHGWSDRQLVEAVQADGVDILVDLAGHTAHNRLTAFARKPAPVQITYLGYPNTTGLSAIDYRLTDAIADPPGAGRYYSEELVRLPGCFLCYRPLSDAPPVSGLPALENGYITFGSFNNLAKINMEVVQLWSCVVKAVPGSKLLIKNSSLTDPAQRQRYYGLFEAQGISRQRLELIGHTVTQQDHLALYARVDVGLDTFPYNGTTTTCEALSMGVPVVTLASTVHAGRVGASLLTSVGLDDWIAGSEEELLEKAAGFAADTGHLARLREDLRDRLIASPLCDNDTFARSVEQAYRGIWCRWCA